jgi:hypothetical protein
VVNSLKAEIEVIRRSLLFDSDWYRTQNGQAADDGVEHFCTHGWRAGARPNPYFDTQWYLAQNPDIAAAGVNPLLHYHAFGEAAGRDPGPWFQVNWYRAAYERGAAPCLAHYLERRHSGQVNPVPVFDGAYYLDTNPDVAAGGADPFEHFMVFGAAEGRRPAADFDIIFYRNRYARYLAGQNPLLHFLQHRHDGLFVPQRPDHEGLVPGAVRAATRPAPYFETFHPLPPGSQPAARLLAYYLPQYHAVPENDAWWGSGFTDWTNLGRALPRFVGHQQPRVPRDLGYYDLSDPRTLPRQVAMARAAGLHGFVFYTYWFNAHRLLEGPLEQLLADPSIDFPPLGRAGTRNPHRAGLSRARRCRTGSPLRPPVCRLSLYPHPGPAIIVHLSRHADPRCDAAHRALANPVRRKPWRKPADRDGAKPGRCRPGPLRPGRCDRIPAARAQPEHQTPER